VVADHQEHVRAEDDDAEGDQRAAETERGRREQRQVGEDEQQSSGDEQRRVCGRQPVVVEVVDHRHVLEPQAVAVPVDPDDEGDDVIQRPEDDEPHGPEGKEVDGARCAEQRRRRGRIPEPRGRRQQRPAEQPRNGDRIARVHRRPVDPHLEELPGEDRTEGERRHQHESGADPGEGNDIEEPPGRQQHDPDRVADFLDRPQILVDAVEFGLGEHRPELVEGAVDGRQDRAEDGEGGVSRHDRGVVD